MGQAVRVTLLGPFSVTVAGRSTGGWQRPSARRLCQLVLVSPDRRITRDLVCEELFPGLEPRAAARSVSRALSMARAALSELGGPAAGLLDADLVHIWAAASAQVDAETHEAALRAALSMPPGRKRDDQLAAALAEERQLLADEPYAPWAAWPREQLEALRQQARLTLARDRARGAGHPEPEAVLAAWQACFEHDAADEEAAAALIRCYLAAGQRELAVRVYERCSTALHELGLRVSPAVDEILATPVTTTPVISAQAKSELRTVTVLSAEVTGPAGGATRLGLEAVRDVVSGALASVISAVESFGGTVTAVSGGGVQAVFGAPIAHEDDPERAVRAAFRALAGAGHTVLRAGVETGPALLGPIGGGGRVEYGAVGDVTGWATALQSSAAPGSVLVGPVTRAATGHMFTWDGTEEVTLGPDAGPVTGTYLGKPKPRASARRPGPVGRGPLTGRAAELAGLSTALANAARGHGSVVLVTGEAGLGKTRLVQECRRLFAASADGRDRQQRWLEGRSASYASATPYGLYQQVLAGLMGVAPDQPEAILRPALDRTLQAVTGNTDTGNTDVLPPLARMMGLPSGAALGRMAPEALRRATFAAWRTVLSRLAATGPTVLALEDLHWADPTSSLLTQELAGLTAGSRLLMLITSRPEGGPALCVPGAELHRIVLTPLPAAAERQLARSLMGEDASQEVLDAVLASADGNPLFLQERLASLLETRALVRDQGRWRLRETAEPEVPQVLERLVRSRVDRLSPPARETIRVASVLGPQFPRALLTAVLPQAAVAELLDKDLLQEAAQGASASATPEPAFRFRHALIQEATYEGLLRAERRDLHGRAAWALEALAGDRAQDDAALLGRHFAAAGDTGRALRYLEIAADHATAAFANDEAILSFRAALAIIDEQPAGDEDTREAAVRLRAKLANVLWRTGERVQAREALADALRLAELASGTGILSKAHLLTRLARLEMAEERFDAARQACDAAAALLPGDPADSDDETVDQWLELMIDARADLHVISGEPELARATLEAARPLLEARGSQIRRCSFYHVLSVSGVLCKRYLVGDDDLANVRLALRAAEQGGEEKDVGYATFFLGWHLWLRGDRAAAGEQLAAALTMAERIGESILRAESLIVLAVLALQRHDAGAVRSVVDETMAAGEAAGQRRYLGRVSAYRAWLAWQDNRPGDVIKFAAQAAEQEETVAHSGFFCRWIYLWPLVAVHLSAGETGPAVAAARQILHPSQQLLPDRLMSVTGQACRAWDQDRPEEAEPILRTALALAGELGYF